MGKERDREGESECLKHSPGEREHFSTFKLQISSTLEVEGGELRSKPCSTVTATFQSIVKQDLEA